MKTKSFENYLEKRLSKLEIAEIKQQAEIEFQTLHSLQEEVSSALNEYVTKEKIGFNELVRRLGVSPTQVLKIQKCQANLTLATLAHISALLKKRPHLVFENKH